MLRKLLSIQIIICMIIPTTMVYGAEILQCKVNDNFSPLNRNQIYLAKYFSNFNCMNIETDDDITLDQKYCEEIYKCQKSDNTNDPSINNDKEFLLLETSELLLRESFYNEMEKFNTDTASRMRLMLSYINGLPADDKKMIKQCSSPVKTADKCLDNPAMDKIAKNYMGDLYFSNLKWNAKEASVSDEKLTVNPKSIPNNQKLRLKILVKEINRTQIDSSADSVFHHMEKDDNEVVEEWTKSSANSLQLNDDKVLEKIMEISSDDSSTMSEKEIKTKVKNILINFSKNETDPVLSYDKSLLNNLLDKHISKIKLSSKDFNPNNERSKEKLFSKLNNLRAIIANDYIINDCNKINLSIGQICSKVATNFKTGNIIKSLKMKRADIFNKMIDHYKISNDKDKNDKIDHLMRMKNEKGQFYQKYLGIMIQANGCDEKFPNEKSASKSRRLKERSEEIEKNSRVNRQNIVIEAINTVKSSAILNNEFKQMGISLNPDVYKNQNNSSISANDSESIAKNAENDLKTSIRTGPASATSYPADNSFIHDEKINASPSNTSFVTNAPPPQDSKLTNEKAVGIKNISDESKLADLQNKEKEMINKTESSSTLNKSIESSKAELAALRDQIDELKKTITKNSLSKTAQDNYIPTNNQSNNAYNSKNYGINNFNNANKSINSTQSNDNLPQANNISNRDSAPAGSSNSTIEKNKPNLILSKASDSPIDLKNIPTNPEDDEIYKLLIDSNGAPFRIFDHGVLMEVRPSLDANNKPQKSNGKIVFKKIVVSKNSKDFKKEDVNIQKSMKEIQPTTRLYELKKVLETIPNKK